MYIRAEKWNDLSTYLFIDLKLSKNKGSLQSIRSRYFILAKYFTLIEFNRDNFNAFIQNLQNKGYKESYINGFIKLAKHIDKYYKLNNLQDYTYFKEHRKRNIDIFTPEDIKRIAELIIPYYRNKEYINQRNRAIYYLLGTTGMRIGELIGLTWDNYFGDYIMLYETKNGDDRPVPVPKFVSSIIDELPRNTHSIFDIKDPTEINNDLKRRCDILGIKKQQTSVHIFRHSFITTMLTQTNTSVLAVAKIVGHHDVKTTYQTYSHLLIDQLKDVQSYHPLCREEATITTLAKKIKEFTEKLIDKDQYVIQITEGVDFQLKVAHK